MGADRGPCIYSNSSDLADSALYKTANKRGNTTNDNQQRYHMGRRCAVGVK